MINRRGHFRVVVDGNPKLPQPITRFEYHVPPLGWRELGNEVHALTKRQNRWTCRIQAEDDRDSYDYEVEIQTPCNVEELDQVMQTYAKNLLEGVDQSKVQLLKLTATTLS